MMPRVNWVFFIVALVGVGGGAALWITNGAAHLVWTATTVVAFVPLVVRVSTSLLRREPGVDLIAVLAMAGALLLGEALAGAVIGLMLASGQVLESYATARASRELMSLLARAPRVAHRWQDSALTTVAVDDVEPGDVLLVKEADVVPVDGVVLEGTASIDASALTGEARPVERCAGDRLESGTVNVGTAFRMRAAARASESTYTGIVRLVEAAQQSKAPAARLADRYAAVFVPLTIPGRGCGLDAVGRAGEGPCGTCRRDAVPAPAGCAYRDCCRGLADGAAWYHRQGRWCSRGIGTG
jgi:cation transport ATPase